MTNFCHKGAFVKKSDKLAVFRDMQIRILVIESLYEVVYLDDT
jgi:hypothetical protein